MRWMLALVMIACAACTDPRIDGTRWRCASDGDCGSGWQCQINGSGGSGFCAPLTAGDGPDGVTDTAGDTGPGTGDTATPKDTAAQDAGPDTVDAGPDAGDAGPVATPDGDAGSDPCAESCDDDNPCTADGCDPVTGCTHTNAPGPCDDGDPCTPDDTCSDGLCEPGGELGCDDDNPCTIDGCDPGTGCVNTNAVSAPCDDGEPCTEDDTCQDGVCQGGTFVCDCQDDGDCVDDGNLCNGVLACDGPTNTCKVDPGTVVSCDTSADPPCQTSECVPGTGACALVDVLFGTSCSDGSLCTVNDACSEGACEGAPADCDDDDPCTDDACNPATGCTHTPRDNGAPCGGGKICVDAACVTPCGSHEVYDATIGACVTSSVSVPSESFWMGCKPGTTEPCQDDERPYHEVELDAYLVDATEVTAAQYDACVQAEACTAVSDGDCGTGTTNYGKPGLTQHPMNCVSWQRAQAYCTWAQKALCTEAQWERAARGGCEKVPGEVCADAMPRYPWGDTAPTCGQHAVFSDGGGGCGTGGTYPVTEGSPLGQSRYGIWDMGGNVWEWVADWYAGDYYCEGPAAVCMDVCSDCVGEAAFDVPWSNPPGPPGGAGYQKIIRGSGYNQGEDSLRTGNRGLFPMGQGSPEVGFRCCAAP